MPLAKLQRSAKAGAPPRTVSSTTSPGARKPAARPSAGPASTTLALRPGVGGWLVRLAPLIRPLVQAKWAARIAARNSDLVDSQRMDEFLFGAQRISPQRIRGPLTESQNRPRFYGAGRLGTRAAVDHFLPWSRHPDNTLDNLAAAHPACNNAKSASLAGLQHLEHWLARFRPGDPASTMLGQIASETGWPRRSDRTLATARATYLWLPPQTRLWQERTAYEPLDTATMRTLFASAA